MIDVLLLVHVLTQQQQASPSGYLWYLSVTIGHKCQPFPVINTHTPTSRSQHVSFYAWCRP